MRQWKVYYFAFGDSQGVELTNVEVVRVTKEQKATSNTVEITLSTTNVDFISDGEIIYRPDETLKLYAANDNVDINDPLHLVGVYTIQNPELSPDSRTIKLQCMDKTYDVLSKIWPGDVTDTPPNIVEKVYKWVLSDTTAVVTADSTKSDGTAFGNIEYFSGMKTAYEVIKDISQPNYTEDDREYLFWVNENDELIWTYPGQTPVAQEFSYGNAEVINMSIGRSEANVVSMIIYNAGKDKDGNNFVDFYLDPNATEIQGRMLYEEMKYISKDLRETSFWSTATNTQIQEELKSRAEDNCRRIVDSIGTGLWETKITTKGKLWEIAQLHNIDAKSFGFPKQPLRLRRVVHRMDKGGWETDLVFEQDPEAVEL